MRSPLPATRLVLKAGVPVLAGALVLTACGSRGSDSSSGGSKSSGGGTAKNTTVTIGFDSPLSKDLAAVGLGMKNSAELAVKKANAAHTVPGVTFKLVAKDDQATPNIGQQNAAAFAADPSVVGVVGAYNSSVTAAMQSTLASANLVQVSGANTNPDLTRGAKYKTAPTRPYKSYFRTITTDDVQAPVLADYFYKTVKLRKVATVDDKKIYGAGLVANFKTEFEKLGGTVTLQQHINPGETDFSAVVGSIKSAGAQGVYYGGEYPEAGPLKKQITGAGLNIPVGGGDATKDDQLIKLAGGSAANGFYATTDGAPAETLPSAKDFIDSYKAAGYSQEYGVFGVYTYDATTALINAVADAVKANGGTAGDVKALRPKVVDAMQKVNFQGATGQIGFNQYGDAITRKISVNEVKNGAWADGVEIVDFK